MSVERYRHLRASVSTMAYHFVWSPKYWRKVLTGRIETRLRALIFRKPEEHCEIAALQVMPNHVHLFLKASTTRAPQHIVHQMKGFTSHQLRSEFPNLKSRLPSLWSRSYYVGSAGAVSAATIQRYIETQKES